MKKCNKCGYPGLDDNATKCRCGAVENKRVPFSIIMLQVGFLTLLELFFLAITIDISSYLSLNNLLISIAFIYIIQCVVYASINIMLNKNTSSKTTTFTEFEVKNPIKKVKPSETNPTSSSQTSSNNSDNLLTGIVIGSLLSHSTNNNHDSYDTGFSSDSCSCD